MVPGPAVSHTRSMHTSPPSTDPPSTDPPVGTPHHRSTSDRMIGGVCGATAGYLGIHRAVATLIFILASAIGGLGVVLYVVLWLFLPDDHGRVLIKGDGGRPGEGFWVAVAAAAASVIVSAWLTRNFPDLVFAVLVGVGVFVLTQRGGSTKLPAAGAGPTSSGPTVTPPPYAPDATSDPTARTTADTTADTTVMPAPAPADAVDAAGVIGWPGPGVAEATDEPGASWAASPDVTSPDVTATPRVEEPTGVLPSIEGTTAVLPRTVPSRRTTMGAERPARPAKPPRPPAFLGPLTVSIAVAVCGVMTLLFATGLWDLRLSDVLITALVIIGLGLLISTWYGRARGLVLLGLLLVPVVLASALVDRIDLTGGIGDRRIAPTAAEDLMGEYRFGVGTLTLDLRELDPATVDGPLRSSLSAGAGVVKVYVPADWTIEIPVTVGIGEVEVRERDTTYDGEGDPPPEWSEWTRSLDSYRRTDVPVDSSGPAGSDGPVVHTVRATGSDGAPTLDLDVDLSIGLVEVFRVES